MLGDAKEDYVVLSSDLSTLRDYLDRGELKSDTERSSIQKVLVLSDIGLSAQLGDDDDEYNVTDMLGRLDELKATYGFDCLNKAVEAFARVILRLSVADIGKLSLFQVLCIYYMFENKRYGYSRGELSELRATQSDQLRFELEFNDVLRAIRYCKTVHGSDGLVCKTVKVSNSRGAIGAIGDYLGNQASDREDVFEKGQAANDEVVIALQGQLDAVSVKLQDAEDAKEKYRQEAEVLRTANDEKVANLTKQIGEQKSEILELQRTKTTLNDKVAQLTVQLNTPMGESSISEYMTITTQSVSTCSVSHVLYFKELSYVFGLASILDVFMKKMDKSNITYRMVIFDDTAYLEGKYDNDIPVVDFKEFAKDKMRYVAQPIVVITSRIISPIEDYLQSDVDVLIVYDRLGARADMVTGGIVSRFIVANSAHDVDRARALFGVTNVSEIICSGYSSATVTCKGLLGLQVNERLVKAMRADGGASKKTAARATQIARSLLYGSNSESLMDVLASKCGDLTLI